MDRFEKMLSPMSVEKFLADYWDQKPLHLTNCEDKDRLKEYPALEDLPGMLAGDLHPEGWVSALGFAQTAFVGSEGQPIPLGVAHSGNFMQFYNAGLSLCFNDLHSRHPVLTDLVNSIANHTELAGDNVTTAYLTPPKSGSIMHFDCQHVFFCQVSGEKNWNISKQPGVVMPPVNILDYFLNDEKFKLGIKQLGVDLTEPKDSDMEEILLKEGEVLYLPPGTWHQPNTQDSHSLHFTLTFMPLAFWHLLYPFLKMIVMRRPEWRRDLRFISQSGKDAERLTYIQERIGELQEELSNAEAEDMLQVFRLTEKFGSFKGEFFRTKN